MRFNVLLWALYLCVTSVIAEIARRGELIQHEFEEKKIGLFKIFEADYATVE
jgi:hypothetical protein